MVDYTKFKSAVERVAPGISLAAKSLQEANYGEDLVIIIHQGAEKVDIKTGCFDEDAPIARMKNGEWKCIKTVEETILVSDKLALPF